MSVEKNTTSSYFDYAEVNGSCDALLLLGERISNERPGGQMVARSRGIGSESGRTVQLSLPGLTLDSESSSRSNPAQYLDLSSSRLGDSFDDGESQEHNAESTPADGAAEITELIEDAVKSAEPILKRAILRAEKYYGEVKDEVIPKILKHEKEILQNAVDVKANWRALESGIYKLAPGNDRYRQWVHNRVDQVIQDPVNKATRDSALDELGKESKELLVLVENFQAAVKTDRVLKERLGMNKMADAIRTVQAAQHAYGKLLKIAGRNEEGNKLLNTEWLEELHLDKGKQVKLRPWTTVAELKGRR